MIVAGFDPAFGVRDFAALAWLDGSSPSVLHVVKLLAWKPRNEMALLRRFVQELESTPAAAVAFDATGRIGESVLALLAQCPLDPRIGLFPVQSRPLMKRPRQADTGTVQAPKRILVEGLRTAISAGRLKCPRTLPYAADLENELLHFREWRDESGLIRYGADQGFHDDLISAVALAIFLSDHLHEQGTVGRFTPLERAYPDRHLGVPDAGSTG